MRVFKSIEDVEAAGLSPPVHGVVHRVVKGFIDALEEYGGTYEPEDDGWTILVEGGDEDEVAAEIGYPLADALFEGVFREEGCFVGWCPKILLTCWHFGTTVPQLSSNMMCGRLTAKSMSRMQRLEKSPSTLPTGRRSPPSSALTACPSPTPTT